MKLDNPEETHVATGRTGKFHTNSKLSSDKPWSCEAASHPTASLYHHRNFSLSNLQKRFMHPLAWSHHRVLDSFY